jgi:urease accessory protein
MVLANLLEVTGRFNSVFRNKSFSGIASQLPFFQKNLERRIMMTKQKRLTATGLLALLSFNVWAHTGHETIVGFEQGWIHPWQGLDHVLVMLTVGLWAATLKMTGRFLLPAVFLSFMALGAWIALQGYTVAEAELWVALTVVLSGLALLERKNFNVLIMACAVALFAFLHGFVHMAEVGTQPLALHYIAGFSASTALLLGLGLVTGLYQRRFKQGWMEFYAYFCATAGLFLLYSAS